VCHEKSDLPKPGFTRNYILKLLRWSIAERHNLKLTLWGGGGVNEKEREKPWARVHVGHVQSKDRIAPEATGYENYRNISLKVNSVLPLRSA
jgi:hypothetical protein